jgi:hypothetical protein
VFTEKANNRRAYWYAAAGVLFFIGFAIYLFRNNSFNEKNDLAIRTEVPTPDAIPEAAPQKPVSNSSKNLSDEVPERERIENQPAPAAILKKPVSAASDKEKRKTLSEDIQFKSIPKKENEQLIASSASDSPQEQSAGAPPQTGAGDNNKALTRDNALSPQPASQSYAMDEKDSPMLSETVVVAKTPSAFRKKGKSAPTAAEDKSVETADAEKAQAFYMGGENALHKEIYTGLERIKLLKSFEATLLLNTTKVVEDVVFTQGDDLTNSEKKQIRKLLMDLKEFQFTVPPKKGTKVEFKLTFRP